MMGAYVQEILDRWGEMVTVRRGEGETDAVRAFVQPVCGRSETVPEAVTTAGWTDGRLWLYLGRTAVQTGDVIVWRGEAFRVRSGRGHYIGNELCHWQAALERERETV